MDSDESPKGRAEDFPHRRLSVYHKALEFAAAIHRLCRRLPAGAGTLRDQLERGARSIVLNIAEGANRRTGREKRQRFVVARGEAGECAEAVELGVTLAAFPKRTADDVIGLAAEVAAMLSGLIRRQG
jgi:four helix bundle protein